MRAETSRHRAALRWTVRLRLTLVASLTVLVVLVGVAVALVELTTRTLTDDLTETLLGDAALVASGSLWESTDGGGGGGGEVQLVDRRGDDDAVTQIVAGDGTVLATSDPDRWAGPLLPFDDVVDELGGASTDGPGRVVRTVDDLDGDDDYLVVAVAPVDALDRVVLVASPLDDIEESRAALLGALAVVVPLVALGMAGAMWVLVGRTLRPVEAIRTEVAGIGGDDLDRRVPEPRGDDEIARLARTMNAMLDRLEGAAVRQREFVADASHELRTPLTRVRSEIEVDLAHPETADPVATHRSVLDETEAMERLVDDLLLLARTESAAAVPDGVDVVDLDLVVLGEAEAVARADLVVDTSEVAPAAVVGDESQIRRAVRNVVQNGARHARSRLALAVVAAPGPAEVELTVTDDGPGVPAAERERVFERFARVDDARTADDGGSGLGLAIARAVVERWGGRISVDDADGGGARFRIVLAAARR